MSETTGVSFLEARYGADRGHLWQERQVLRENARPKFSLLCPTRERPAGAMRLIDSVESSAVIPERVECFFYVDSDDPSRPEYERLFAQAPMRHPRLLGTRLLSGKPKSVSLSWNDLAGASTGDVLLMANDDQVYGQSGWDIRLDEEISKFPDEIYCIWFDDGINGEKHCAFPIVSRRWYETLGYFTPGIFEFLFNDTWIMALADLLGRLHYVADVRVEHLHHSADKSAFDVTYQRQSSTFDRDAYLFVRTEPVRRRDARLLLRVIEAAMAHQARAEEVRA